MINYGMVGGDINAFIGEVHRKSIGFDTRAKLVCGCFSRNEEKNVETANEYGLNSNRVYKSYLDMAIEEGKRGELDFVSVCTPNFSHYEVSKAFLENGINVVCEKPLCFEVEQALELEKLAKEKNLIFAVTYTYSGYTMVKVARDIVKNGEIGNIININAEYPQEWLIDDVISEEGKTAKLSIWRKDPKYSGISNCVGDIGTHIENTISFVTGLEIKRLRANLNNYGQQLDLNANILVQYDNGVFGNYWASQVAISHMNGLKFRIYGDKGSLIWSQESPDQLQFTRKGEAPQILSRGCGYLKEESAKYARIPSGHPEGYHIAFANLYKDIMDSISNKKQNKEYNIKFPTIKDGVRGVKFIHAVVKSSNNDGEWVDIK